MPSSRSCVPPRPVTADPTRAPRPLAVVLGVLVALLTVLVVPAAARASEGSRGPDPVGVWPLAPQPAVVAPFDPPPSPYAAGHRGVDLAGSVGQAVRAALPGRVSFAGRVAGRGVVVVSHGTTRTTYEPVAASVAVGDDVGAGTVVGVLELPGSHCFPRACLHWGWVEGASTYLDPLRLVGDGPVRLLPLWRDRPATAPPARASPPAPPMPLPRPLPRALWRGLLAVLG